MAEIIKIFICKNAGEELQEVSSVEIVEAKGIVGDRYFFGNGTFSNLPKGNPKRRDVTFISIDEIDRFNREQGLEIPCHAFRRNIVTTGIDLNKLVGEEFEINGCRFYGFERCEPCAHLARVVHSSVVPHMVKRCGLRATVLTGGTLTEGCEFAS